MTITKTEAAELWERRKRARITRRTLAAELLITERSLARWEMADVVPHPILVRAWRERLAALESHTA